jgi:hypothetical protein
MRRPGFRFQPRQPGRQLEQQRQELPVSESQQEHPVEHEQQPGLPHREHTSGRSVPSARTRVSRPGEQNCQHAPVSRNTVFENRRELFFPVRIQKTARVGIHAVFQFNSVINTRITF